MGWLFETLILILIQIWPETPSWVIHLTIQTIVHNKRRGLYSYGKGVHHLDKPEWHCSSTILIKHFSPIIIYWKYCMKLKTDEIVTSLCDREQPGVFTRSTITIGLVLKWLPHTVLGYIVCINLMILHTWNYLKIYAIIVTIQQSSEILFWLERQHVYRLYRHHVCVTLAATGRTTFG